MTPSEHTFDVAIIGGGSGGMAAAKRAASRDLRTVLFEPRQVGGVCVNRGCVPKKLLLDASRHHDAILESRALGWDVGEPKLDWPALYSSVQDQVGSISASQAESLEEAGVELEQARVRLAGDGRIVADGGADGEWQARHIVIATGARPLVPDLPGAKLALVSDDLFGLESLPQNIALIGGGYIAIEFACMLNRFGVAVTIFESSDHLLDGFDTDLVQALQESMRQDGIEIVTGVTVTGIEKSDGGKALSFEQAEPRKNFAEVALVIGRVPNVEDLGLDVAGVELNERGQIGVDGFHRTSAANVYAIGDVAVELQLTPIAIEGGESAIDVITGHPFRTTPEEEVPTAVYSTPECGAIGLTAARATELGIDHEVRHTEFRPLGNLLATRERRVRVKLVVERVTGRLLGFHALGPNVAEATQLAAIVIGAGLGERDLLRTMSLHPTHAEEIIGLGRSAGALGGRLRAE